MLGRPLLHCSCAARIYDVNWALEDLAARAVIGRSGGRLRLATAVCCSWRLRVRLGGARPGGALGGGTGGGTNPDGNSP